MSDDYTPPTPAQVETVVGALDDGTEISIIMRAFYPLLLERAWERAGEQVQLGTAFDLRNPRVQETIAGLAQKVRRVADTTRDDVRRVMALVDADGISYNQAAKLLRGVTETLADGTTVRPFDAPYRAFMIAVTESAYAYSRGQVLAWQESGEVDRMQWVAETNACAICNALNGQVVTLGGPFGSGREVPAHPNCRCTLSPVLKDEFSMPAAPVSAPPTPVSAPPTPVTPRPASFTIKPDGTLDYTPSQYAEQIHADIVNVNSQFRQDMDKTDRAIRRLEQEGRVLQAEITKQNSILRSQTSSARRTQATQALAKAAARLKQVKADVAVEYANIPRLLSTLNPTPLGVGATRPPVIVTPEFNILSPTQVTSEDVQRSQDLIALSHQILETFIPTVNANGQPVTIGWKGVLQANLNPMRRASYSVKNNAINVDASDSIGTYVHEILHGIEYNNPTMAARIAAWFKTRTPPKDPNSRLQRLSKLTGNRAYRSTEETRPDKFANYYIGKEYNTAGTSEVLSTFAGYLLDERAATSFFREDPEWVKFCIDVLADPGSYQ